MTFFVVPPPMSLDELQNLDAEANSVDWQIAQQLREARAGAGYTQKKLSYLMQHKGARVSQQRISDWENGKTNISANELVVFQKLVKSEIIRGWF